MSRKVEKTPAMPLYGGDAYTDEDFALLEWGPQGLFWRLAFWQWQEGSIPDDVERIVAIVGKGRTTRALWPEVRQLFEPHPDLPGRLYNRTTEEHRTAILTKRGAHQRGAQLTNQKLGRGNPDQGVLLPPDGTLSDPLSERLASPERVASREDKTNQDKGSSVGEGAGEGGALTPQQQAVDDVLRALERETVSFALPTPQRLAKVIHQFGRDAILGTIHDMGPPGKLDGKTIDYLFRVLENNRRSHGNSSPPKRSTAGTDRRAAPGAPSGGAAGGGRVTGRFQPRRPSQADIDEAKRVFSISQRDGHGGTDDPVP